MKRICEMSGKEFDVSEHEMELRKKFGFGDTYPKIAPKYRFQYLGAFWPHWNLHKRNCDKTGASLISIFRPDCEYPIWKRSEWVDHNDPPYKDFDFSKPFFAQAWELFKKCPLPHIFESHNQNCEYTDDWYYSKNCYLSHSGEYSEDCHYCYAMDHCKDVNFGAFGFYSEMCFDLINSKRCINGLFLLDCQSVSSSAFLYDCRNCHDCMFCFNLRDKKFCFENKQLSKEKYEKKKSEWDLTSRKVYGKAKENFTKMMRELAWHRALHIDLCENSTGNFIRECKDCENCYLLSKHENCCNDCFSGPDAKSTLDSLGTIGGELIFMTSLPVFSYYAIFSFSISHCKFVEYCAYMLNCKNCFGCCGLNNRQYCILNKQYSKEEYEKLRAKIIDHMKKTGRAHGASAQDERGSGSASPSDSELINKEWGEFFPGYFAPNPYEESFSGFRFPLKNPDKFGFRKGGAVERESVKTAEISEIPDSWKDLDEDKEKWLLDQIFWDDVYKRSFRITKRDIDFARKISGPLPGTYYVNRMHENLMWMPFNGELREARCAKSGDLISTNWPSEYDSRILSEKEYLNIVR